MKKLDESDIESDIKKDEVKEKIKTMGVGNRKEIKILNNDGEWGSTIYLDNTNNNISEDGGPPVIVEVDNAVYPTGKTKADVVRGDIVKIGTEEFYVVKHNGDKIVLLSRYNLNVGSNPKGTATGKQDSNVKGWISGGTTYGNMPFSSSSYWNDGPSLGGTPKPQYPGSYSDPNYPNIFDNNSGLFNYVNNYKTYIEGLLGRSVEARLLYYSEAAELGCSKSNQKCYGAPNFVSETSYWLGSAGGSSTVWTIANPSSNFRSYYSYTYSDDYGVRPVIVY